MLVTVAVLLVVGIFVAGALYLKLHSLPEHMAHGVNRTQYQLVAILALIALFTHENLFWVAALLLAAVQLPNLMYPLESIAASLAKATGRDYDYQSFDDTPPDQAQHDAEAPLGGLNKNDTMAAAEAKRDV
ncbi:hypothetical protein [Chachezhania sediminis]|uniref:hypothetical protein n=1 Tax=Chachezhania sediminis TaxID=2599291 RepID=UPI00131D6693|nr:hypothetical protein [Chachezhania sediminis]